MQTHFHLSRVATFAKSRFSLITKGVGWGWAWEGIRVTSSGPMEANRGSGVRVRVRAAGKASEGHNRQTGDSSRHYSKILLVQLSDCSFFARN